MNPLAQNLNNQLVDHCPEILSMLSNLGQSMYYPKGILSQSAMLKTKYNATIGMATNKNGKMYAILYLMSIIIYLQMKSFHTPHLKD